MPAEVATSVSHGDGTSEMLRDNDPDAGTIDFHANRKAFAGKPIGSGWRVHALDEVTNVGVGTWSSPSVAVAYRRARGPFAAAATFTSRPRPTPGAIAIDAIRIEGNLPATAMVTAELRACESETTCHAAAWEPAGPEMTPLAGTDFVQYRLTIACDTHDPPEIDKVAIDYRTAE
jgi:hypothetical protein